MKTLALWFVLVATPAFADEALVAQAPQKTFGIDGAAVLPVGDYGNAANFGAGALARLEIPAGGGYVTGRAGVLFHAATVANTSLTLIPLYAGYRYPLGATPGRGAYLAGELGITFATATTSVLGSMVSGSDSELGATIGVGSKLGQLDVRGQVFVPDLFGDGGTLVGLMATVGYDFMVF